MPSTSRSSAAATQASTGEEALPGVLVPVSASQHGVHVVAQVDKQERRWLEERVLIHLVLVSVFTAAYSQTEAT